MEHTPLIVFVNKALDVSHIDVVAIVEARSVARVVELEGGATMQYATDIVDKVGRAFNTVKNSTDVEANRFRESLVFSQSRVL